ncbi:phage tail tape measure protein [Saccharibacillus alkalitolerans]|uniref:Phage tail tape measure protein n=1 Tax=Saccharibacillus alkalitolerans TaxID=2705290 RepID=A0ABX0F4U3_9BACL|nr:phage tail tape measure protein [Saccharibacillus alkalitolerans]NGZ75998.1 phage tail tape measure protein [Saccharibacillus alkalitolerans]
MDNLMASIRSVRLRLQIFKICAFAFRGLLIGLAAAVLLSGAAYLIPIPRAALWAAVCALLGAAAGAAAACLRPVGTEEAARAMDAADPAEERRDLVTTALEFADRDSSASRWQRAQAEAYGLEFAAKRRERLPFGWKFGRAESAASALVVVCALLLLLPNPMDGELRQREREQALIDAQQKRAEALAKELNEAPIPPEERAPLAESAAGLAKELGNSRRAEEALDKMEEAMKELGRQADTAEKQQQELQDWNRQIAAQQALKEAAKQQAADASERAEALKNAVSKLSEQQKEQLANAMKGLAEQAPKEGKETAALQKALQKAAEQLAASGKLSDEQIQDLAEKLAASAAESGSLGEQSELAAEAAAQLAQSGMDMAGQLAASGMSVSDAWGKGGAAQALADAASAAEGGSESANASEGSQSEGAEGQSADGEGSSGSGQGSGSQGRSGQGSGSGQGQGQGRGNGSGSGGNGSGQGGGAGWGSGGRELVTTPRDLKGEGNVQSDGGPSSGGDKQTGGVSPTIDGVSRPYEEVYGEYSERAKDSLGRSDLPQSVQGLVESYFTEIRPES